MADEKSDEELLKENTVLIDLTKKLFEKDAQLAQLRAELEKTREDAENGWENNKKAQKRENDLTVENVRLKAENEGLKKELTKQEAYRKVDLEKLGDELIAQSKKDIEFNRLEAKREEWKKIRKMLHWTDNDVEKAVEDCMKVLEYIDEHLCAGSGADKTKTEE